MYKLKPCPFCGGKASFKAVLTGKSNIYNSTTLKIACERCKAEIPKNFEVKTTIDKNGDIKFDKDERADAATLWNRRCAEVEKQTDLDDITMAIHNLDIFTKNWCINRKETEEKNSPVFRCSNCPFENSEGVCLVKAFASSQNNPNYPMDKFGSMA